MESKIQTLEMKYLRRVKKWDRLHNEQISVELEILLMKLFNSSFDKESQSVFHDCRPVTRKCQFCSSLNFSKERSPRYEIQQLRS